RLEPFRYEPLQRFRIDPETVARLAQIHVGAAEAHGAHRSALPRTVEWLRVAIGGLADVSTTPLTVLAADEDECVALGAPDRRESRVTEGALRGICRNRRAAVGAVERACVHVGLDDGASQRQPRTA